MVYAKPIKKPTDNQKPEHVPGKVVQLFPKKPRQANDFNSMSTDELVGRIPDLVKQNRHGALMALTAILFDRAVKNLPDGDLKQVTWGTLFRKMKDLRDAGLLSISIQRDAMKRLFGKVRWDDTLGDKYLFETAGSFLLEYIVLQLKCFEQKENDDKKTTDCKIQSRDKCYHLAIDFAGWWAKNNNGDQTVAYNVVSILLAAHAGDDYRDGVTFHYRRTFKEGFSEIYNDDDFRIHLDPDSYGHGMSGMQFMDRSATKPSPAEAKKRKTAKAGESRELRANMRGNSGGGDTSNVTDPNSKSGQRRARKSAQRR